MGKYKIKIEFQTGDSFSNSDETDYLDLSWDNLDIAKANLQSIKEHYDMYTAINSYGRNPSRESLYEKNKDKSWFVNNPILYCISQNNAISEDSKSRYKEENLEYRPDDYYAQNCIIIKTDKNKDFQMSAFWCGYFESLYSAEIEIDQSDMKIVF